LPPNTQGNCSFTYLNSTDSTSHTLNQVYRGEVCGVGSGSPTDTPASSPMTSTEMTGIVFAIISVVATLGGLFIGVRRLRIAYKSYLIKRGKGDGGSKGSKGKNKASEEEIELVERQEENKAKGD